MRIVLTGGGTGGHFYPLIAVAEAVRDFEKESGIKNIELFYFSTDPQKEDELKRLNIHFKKVPSGKVRTYKSPKNIIDKFKTLYGIFVAFGKLFLLYPDVVFSKGGYASFPTLVAAKIFAIPVVIHESDTVPGRVNLWSSKFADRVAVSWSEAAEYFKKEKTAHTGQPIRKALFTPQKEGAYEEFSLKPDIPVITVLGGSQGAQRVNEHILDILPTLLEHAQVIHQTGEVNYEEVVNRSRIVLERNDYKDRYHVMPFLSDDQMKKMAGITNFIISRSGSIIFEIALWGIPAILIPIPESISRDQTKNAFSYARAGAGSVIEEENLTPHLFIAEVNKILSSQETYESMRESAKKFAKEDAAEKIAKEVIEIAQDHE